MKTLLYKFGRIEQNPRWLAAGLAFLVLVLGLGAYQFLVRRMEVTLLNRKALEIAALAGIDPPQAALHHILMDQGGSIYIATNPSQAIPETLWRPAIQAELTWAKTALLAMWASLAVWVYRLVLRRVRLADEVRQKVKALGDTSQILAETESLMKTIADNSVDVIWRMNLSLTFTYVSPSIYEVTGYRPQEWVGTRLFEHTSRAEFWKMARVALGAVRHYREFKYAVIEAKFFRKNGDEFPVEIIGKLLLNDSGIPVGLQGSTRDITERKRADAALREYSDRLEEMVAERTRELEQAQDRLIQQERLAVLGSLAGGVGHELRNPLGVITNAIYYLKMVMPDIDPHVAEYLEMIDLNARDATQIVADLMDFARNQRANRTPAAVADLVDQVLSQNPAPPNITTSHRFPDLLPPVLVDRGHMRRVLTNLVTNAYQAMPQGGTLHLQAGLVQVSPPQDQPALNALDPAQSSWIAITVEDSGQGIAPEHIGQIFEPLFTTKTRGIGLGLAISKKLVEANGGWIEVDSRPGEGATFRLYLPLAA